MSTELSPQAYRSSLVKTFAKTLADGYFPFVIVDDVNAKVGDFKEYRRLATLHGFAFYLVEMENDLAKYAVRMYLFEKANRECAYRYGVRHGWSIISLCDPGSIFSCQGLPLVSVISLSLIKDRVSITGCTRLVKCSKFYVGASAVSLCLNLAG